MKLSKLRVVDLRKQLKSRGLNDKGTRPSLMKRLKEAIQNEKNSKERQPKNENNARTEHQAQPTNSNSRREHSDGGEKQKRETDEGRRYQREDGNFDDDERTLEADSRPNSSAAKRRYRDASDEDGGTPPAPSSKEQTPPVPDTISNEPGAEQNKEAHTKNESPTSEEGAKELGKNGKPDNASQSPSKVNATCNIQSTTETPTDERMRRRLERFGAVEKTETAGSPPEDEAFRRRRERFGIVSAPKTAEKSGAKKTDKSVQSEESQHEHNAAKRRRALKFGVGEKKKRDFSDTGVSPEEIEKRLKRQRRFQNVC